MIPPTKNSTRSKGQQPGTAPLTPRQIVGELDKFIVGQGKAKRAVAIALRNRWRRAQVDMPLRQEITPKNILLIGPTGVGKTEIARRLARLANAPFIKIEATKFTEVGYVGRDVESIIRDLTESAVKEQRERAKSEMQGMAEVAAQDRVLDILLPPARSSGANFFNNGEDESSAASGTRAKFREKLISGELDDKEIEVELSVPNLSAEIFAPPGMEELANQIQGMFQHVGGGKKNLRKMKIREALRVLQDEEAAKLINDEEVKHSALKNVEENGIVFLDEIDKIATRSEGQGSDVSRQGVQRDLLPLVEGTTVSTKHGMVSTDHILFIASGAFHLAKPSDLIPELQGRFPIRVELDSLSVEDFERILTQTDACLIRQYQALMLTDGVDLKFDEKGVRRLAEVAFEVNEKTENIGARRLYTVMEKLLEELSFKAGDDADDSCQVSAAYVSERLSELAKDEDLSRYVL